MDSVKEKNIPLGYFHLAFGSFAGLYVLSGIFETSADIRYILILISTVILVSLFILSHRNGSGFSLRQPFSMLTVLWIVKSISFAVIESPLLPHGKSVLIYAYIDIYLLIFIFLATGISFIVKRPYFYKQANTFLYPLLGGIFLLLSVVSVIGATVAFKDSILLYMEM